MPNRREQRVLDEVLRGVDVGGERACQPPERGHLGFDLHAMDVARAVTTTTAHVRWGEIAEAALVIPGVHKAITGTVVRNEMPVPGARVTATSSAGTQARPLWTTTDTDGNFRLPCLREGDYTLHATAPPALRSMDVTVPTGESAALQLYSEHDDD